MDNLEKRVVDLEKQYQLHRHLGSDKTQTLRPTVYGGMVLADAATSFLPGGWTVTVNGSNIYTITHNLGTTSYAVVAQVLSDTVNGGFNIDAGALGSANSFNLDWKTSGSRVKADFNFVLVLIN